eukprot:TRINITY_DN30397_c0_g1_i1.p1 TRINITY_DN30397_c0_g1~~TRINITY_DN30397_c0_g1_i1.p1  ORF type:complete len:424 (-),score=66.61 TRINITY_DN30397_c0_g1_i1:102-1373(-)
MASKRAFVLRAAVVVVPMPALKALDDRWRCSRSQGAQNEGNRLVVPAEANQLRFCSARSCSCATGSAAVESTQTNMSGARLSGLWLCARGVGRASGLSEEAFAVCEYGDSVWDKLLALSSATQRGVARGAFYETQDVLIKEPSRGQLTMQPSSFVFVKGQDETVNTIVPFGRATPSLPGTVPCWGLSVACPVAELKRKAISLPRRFPVVGLAVVVIAVDSIGRVLLTRRTPKMRTFPTCWVFPGGSVDAGEDLLEAGARELAEETGIAADVASMKYLCLWESVYPTSSEECMREGLVKGHTIAIFVTARVSAEEAERLELQQAECDRCTWVPLSVLQSLHMQDNVSTSQESVSGWRVRTEEQVHTDGEHAGSLRQASPVGLLPDEVAPSQLRGIYPNAMGEGIGQGHLFAIAVLTGLASRQRL